MPEQPGCGKIVESVATRMAIQANASLCDWRHWIDEAREIIDATDYHEIRAKLELTRLALKSFVKNEFTYKHLLGAIDAQARAELSAPTEPVNLGTAPNTDESK